MTKEELKQEAEEYADKYGKSNFDLWDTARFAYYQGAEPREKRIAELEKKLTEKVTLESLDVVSARIKELEKENAELKAKIYGGGYEAVITKKDADIILLEHLLKEQKELHKSVCDQLTHTHRNLGNQLTKAKELLEELYDCIPSSSADYYKETLQKVADFLKDSEVEK